MLVQLANPTPLCTSHLPVQRVREVRQIALQDFLGPVFHLLCLAQQRPETVVRLACGIGRFRADPAE